MLLADQCLFPVTECGQAQPRLATVSFLRQAANFLIVDYLLPLF